MSNKDELILSLVSTIEAQGCLGIVPKILNEAGNLIIHLSPYSILARVPIATSKGDADSAFETLAREVRVAHHLHSKGIPVLMPIDNAGPHKVGDAWATLWTYIPRIHLMQPSSRQAVELVTNLSAAMKSLPEPLSQSSMKHV